MRNFKKGLITHLQVWVQSQKGTEGQTDRVEVVLLKKGENGISGD